MMQKGSLPTVGQIELELDESKLKMLERGLINELPITATISLPHKPTETKKIIKIILLLVSAPGSHESTSKIVSAGSNMFNEQTANGLARASNYFLDKIIARNSWLLFGKIQGENPVPIIILFSINFNIGTYSFRKTGETDKEFNPRLN